MDGIPFTFDGVNALYYNLNKIRLSRGKSYIDSPEWLENKKATMNSKNNNYKCLNYWIKFSKHQKQSRKNIKN